MRDSPSVSPFSGVTNFTRSCSIAIQPIPLAPYRSREFFEAERERVFGRSWLVVGRVEEIPSYGDYITRVIDPSGVSALIARGKDQKIRAFYNSCSHRGSQVVAHDKGNRKRIICPYHSWSYSTQGELLTIPDEQGFFNIDKAQCGLTPMSFAIWEGWMFINLQREPEVSLMEFLGPLAERLAGISYMAAENPVVISTDLDANWKVVADAFIESYHIPSIHGKTIASTFSSNENRFARLLDAQIYGPHRTVSMYGNPNPTLLPQNKVEILAYAGSGADSVIAAGEAAAMAEFLAHPAVNPTRSNSWSMDVNHVFPNTQIDFGPGGFWVHQFWPTSPNTSRYEVKFYVPPAATVRQRLQQELYVARVFEVVLEDLSNVARTQKGIDSGGKDFMQLQDSEVGIRHSTLEIIKWTEASSVQEALA